MLILAGCLFYSIFNALFFVFVYYRRRRYAEEEELFSQPNSPNLQVQRFQIVPLDKVSVRARVPVRVCVFLPKLSQV